MASSILSSFGPVELVAAALSLPLFSLVIAAVLVSGAQIMARLRGTSESRESTTGLRHLTTPARYRLELQALGAASVLVIAVYAAENVVRGYLLNLADVVEWWQYATPVFTAAVGLLVALVLIAVRGTTRSEVPVVPTGRRVWSSFSSRAALMGTGSAIVALLGTTIAAGLASSADDRGRYIYLELPIPNTQVEALHPWFYGWSFGVPVLVCLTVLVVVTGAVLRGNAHRPFLRPDTVGAEGRARTELASGVARIATAGALLALGGAFRFIGRYGSMSQVTVSGDGGSETYDIVWQYGGIALAAGLLAPLLEVVAFTLLLTVAGRLLIGNSSGRPTASAPEAQAESVR